VYHAVIVSLKPVVVAAAAVHVVYRLYLIKDTTKNERYLALRNLYLTF